MPTTANSPDPSPRLLRFPIGTRVRSIGYNYHATGTLESFHASYPDGLTHHVRLDRDIEGSTLQAFRPDELEVIA